MRRLNIPKFSTFVYLNLHSNSIKRKASREFLIRFVTKEFLFPLINLYTHLFWMEATKNFSELCMWLILNFWGYSWKQSGIITEYHLLRDLKTWIILVLVSCSSLLLRGVYHNIYFRFLIILYKYLFTIF